MVGGAVVGVVVGAVGGVVGGGGSGMGGMVVGGGCGGGSSVGGAGSSGGGGVGGAVGSEGGGGTINRIQSSRGAGNTASRNNSSMNIFLPLSVIAVEMLVILLMLSYRLMNKSLFDIHYEDFAGTATVVSKERIPSCRTGAMVHHTTPAKYLVFYKTDRFKDYLNSREISNLLEVGDIFWIEGRITYKTRKGGTGVPEFSEFDLDVVKKNEKIEEC